MVKGNTKIKLIDGTVLSAIETIEDIQDDFFVNKLGVIVECINSGKGVKTMVSPHSYVYMRDMRVTEEK